MTNATKSPRKTAPKAPAARAGAADKFPATCELDAPVHAKVEAFRGELEGLTGVRISFASAMRKIVNDWADGRPNPAHR